MDVRSFLTRHLLGVDGEHGVPALGLRHLPPEAAVLRRPVLLLQQPGPALPPARPGGTGGAAAHRPKQPRTVRVRLALLAGGAQVDTHFLNVDFFGANRISSVEIKHQ